MPPPAPGRPATCRPRLSRRRTDSGFAAQYLSVRPRRPAALQVGAISSPCRRTRRASTGAVDWRVLDPAGASPSNPTPARCCSAMSIGPARGMSSSRGWPHEAATTRMACVGRAALVAGCRAERACARASKGGTGGRAAQRATARRLRPRQLPPLPAASGSRVRCCMIRTRCSRCAW